MTKKWEDRFDDYRNHLKWCAPEVINDRYKSFIRIELAKQRTKLLARVREAVVKDIPDCSVCYGYKEILKKLEIISEEIKE